MQADAHPENIEDDWVAHFFDRCRLISDEEMQQLWARVLAGEANSPGQYSKRTINILASLDKADAQLFSALCSFIWVLPEEGFVPLIYDFKGPIYDSAGINPETIMHLVAIGLISFEPLVGYVATGMPQDVTVSYYGESVHLVLQQTSGEAIFAIGSVLLTKAGEELAQVCGSEPMQGFKEYVMKKWTESGHTIVPKDGIDSGLPPDSDAVQ